MYRRILGAGIVFLLCNVPTNHRHVPLPFFQIKSPKLLPVSRSFTSIHQNSSDSKLPKGLASVPLEAQSSISSIVGRDLPGYEARPRADGFEAENKRDKLAVHFTGEGVELLSGTAFWKTALRSYGYGEARRAVPAAVPEASSNRVEYHRGVLTEWYVNGPLGLEQGFRLSERPSVVKNSLDATQVGSSRSQPLTIALALSGNVTARLDQARKGLTLISDDGISELRYTGLTAYDATGAKLPSSLELEGGLLLLEVEDEGAQYPVTIDPWVQVAQLTASDGAVGAALGFSVAIDGNTVVAGAPCENSCRGAAYVFVNSGSGWANMTQTAKLTVSDASVGDEFGYSVAIVGDTLVAGAPFALTHKGAAYVFVKPAGGWTNMTETAKLTASDAESNDVLGGSVAVSGNTVVAGASCAHFSSPNCGPGAVYLFSKPISGWSNMTQTVKLTASDAAPNGGLGQSVAISGNTAVAAGFGGGKEATYVFVEPATGWRDMTQTAKLVGGFPEQSLAITGNTVVSAGGTPFAACLFIEPASGWTNMTPTALLSASDEKPGYFFGSVAISGRTVVVGQSPGTVGDQVTAYVFVEPENGWANMTETARLAASSGDRLSAVAVSGDTVLAGIPRATIGSNSNEGGALIFESTGLALTLRSIPYPTPTVQGGLLTYAFKIWNDTSVVAVHEVLTTEVPAGTTFSGITISGTPGVSSCSTPPVGGTGPVICHEHSGMAPHTTWTLRMTVHVTAPTGTVITETATASSDNLGSDTVTVHNTVHSSLVVDQSFTAGFNAGLNINECCAFIAQTFTAGVSGTLGGVSVEVRAITNSMLPLHVAIRTVRNGVPTSTVLGGTDLNSSAPLSSIIRFLQNIAIEKGQQYAIVVNYLRGPPPGAGQAQGIWDGATGNLYTRGAAYASVDGTSWSLVPNVDAFFKTYMLP